MQTRYDRCPNCMQALPQGEDTCPYCNFDVAGYEEKKNCLKPFTVLQNKYMLGRVLGVGGFGITYLGWDLNLQTYIAIKEYFPDSFASRETDTTVKPSETKAEVYNKGLTRYVEEARNLSKFYNLQGIVSVKDFFYENGTGYIVMEYINGINLKEYLNNNGGKLPEQTVLALMKPVFESLYQIHNSGLVHRDISPDNIMVDKDGKIKLIDFGSARGQSSAETDKTYTVILKHGYAPAEQYYAKGNQGPWTDIYSLCATMYKMLTGQIPPNSVERMEEDAYQSPAALGIPVSQRTEAVLAKGLAVKANDRYQNIGELLAQLYGNAPIQQPNMPPQNSAPSYANPVSANPMMGYAPQSMQLAERPAPKKKSKAPLIAGISAGVVAFVVGLVLILGGGEKGGKKGTTESTGAATTTTEDVAGGSTETEEKTTEATTEANSYVWPTELSDDWRDYTINLDGTIYQLPLPYSEFKTKGWRTDDVLTDVAGGDYDYASFYNDHARITVYVMNFGLNEAKLDDCYVIGFSFDSDYDDYTQDFSIELAGNIKLFSSTVDDIKSVFGAPDYIYDGTSFSTDEPYTAINYAGDGERDGYDLKVTDAKNLVEIAIMNTNPPEGATGTAADLNTDEPAINASYQAPNGLSADRFDSIISVEGTSYQLPVPFTEFEKAGWKLDSSADPYLNGRKTLSTKMEKDGQSIEIELANYTASAILTKYAMVTTIRVETKYCNKEVVFPGGLKLGSSGDDFASVYGDCENYSSEDYGMFTSYYVYLYDYETKLEISVGAYTDPDTNIIDEMKYSNNTEPQ